MRSGFRRARSASRGSICAQLSLNVTTFGSSTRPVLGTRGPAESADLVILASGPAEAVDRCEVIFDAIGSRTLRLGEVGNGTRCKLAINSWILGLTTTLAETIALCEGLGIDPRSVLRCRRRRRA